MTRVFDLTHRAVDVARVTAGKLALVAVWAHVQRMDRRHRRSTDRRTALHLFLESQLVELGARSLRVMGASGDIVAGVGDDSYSDEWRPTWTLPVESTSLVVACSGGCPTDGITWGIRRIVGDLNWS